MLSGTLVHVAAKKSMPPANALENIRVAANRVPGFAIVTSWFGTRVGSAITVLLSPCPCNAGFAGVHVQHTPACNVKHTYPFTAFRPVRLTMSLVNNLCPPPQKATQISTRLYPCPPSVRQQRQRYPTGERLMNPASEQAYQQTIRQQQDTIRLQAETIRQQQTRLARYQIQHSSFLPHVT